RLRRVLMSALIQPPTTRRQGNQIRQTQSPLITASSRSRSNGAMEIGCHMKRTRRGRATQRQLGPSQYQRAHYTNVSMELLFSHPAFANEMAAKLRLHVAKDDELLMPAIRPGEVRIQKALYAPQGAWPRSPPVPNGPRGSGPNCSQRGASVAGYSDSGVCAMQPWRGGHVFRKSLAAPPAISSNRQAARLFSLASIPHAEPA